MRLRHAAVAAALALVWSCAHVEAPTGGPEDKTPPALLVTRPDTLGVVPGWNAPAVLVFDERLSERGLREAVLVSPRTSVVDVDHRGDEIRVRLRGGWQPGTIYHVTVMPGVQDLFGNRIAEPATLVFSTGPQIPATAIAGVVTDPLTGKPEVGVRVEAVRTADSLVYAVPTDSVGRYTIRRIPEGEYRVRAFRDLNRNRALDNFEPRGVAMATMTAGDSLQLALGVLMPDSTPPQLALAEVRDSLTFALDFDDHLDPSQQLQATVQLISAGGGSLSIPVERVVIGEKIEAQAAAQPARAQQADTAAAGPLPSQTVLLQIGSHLRIRPGAKYAIRIENVRNVVGLNADVETEVDVPLEAAEPRPVAPPDSASSPDTARVSVRDLGRPGTPEP